MPPFPGRNDLRQIFAVHSTRNGVPVQPPELGGPQQDEPAVGEPEPEATPEPAPEEAPPEEPEEEPAPAAKRRRH